MHFEEKEQCREKRKMNRGPDHGLVYRVAIMIIAHLRRELNRTSTKAAKEGVRLGQLLVASINHINGSLYEKDGGELLLLPRILSSGNCEKIAF